MRKLFRRTPSAPLVISILALVLAASGSAMAASKLVSGNSLIKQHSLSGNRLKNHTLTGTQINLSKLGTVPRAASANSATTATSAATATSATTAGSAPISTVTYVKADGNDPANAILPLTASCPSGTVVIGGGGSLSDESGAAYIDDSYPSGNTGWTVDFNNSNDAVSVVVTAICAPAAATSGS
ncbi:MAG TPA: hypothetical protein VMV16_10255 [Solirubrobacteraceae bacterium]|nr:hypothetical protein [Solirubrobacteraceae bacterium]